MLASIALGADNPLGATTAKTIWRYAKTMFEIKMMELAIMMISYHINNLAKRPTLTFFTIWAKKLHTSTISTFLAKRHINNLTKHDFFVAF